MELIDSHLHFGDISRLDSLLTYLGAGVPERISRLGLISLPLADYINFNPELILAKSADPENIDIFASFDHWSKGRGSFREQTEEFIALGFDGLKLWEGKPDLQAELGMPVDHPELLAAYRTAAEADLPILIHIADPPRFWLETGGPWSYVGRNVPGFDLLIEQAESVCRQVPEARFIFPHLLFLAGDLERLRRFLDRHPNALLDLAPGRYLYPALAGIAPGNLPGSERRIEASRHFFNDYCERILFGSDALFLPDGIAGLPGADRTQNLARLRTLRNFLISDAEFENPFPLNRNTIPTVRGLRLEPDVLDSICQKNYRRIMGVKPARLNQSLVARYLERFHTAYPERVSSILTTMTTLRDPT